jgi:hypothetical protein
MKYYITTPQIAELISRNKALENGCGPVTKYWWSWIINYSNPLEAALCFQDNEDVEYETVDTLGSEWYPPQDETLD